MIIIRFKSISIIILLFISLLSILIIYTKEDALWKINDTLLSNTVIINNSTNLRELYLQKYLESIFSKKYSESNLYKELNSNSLCNWSLKIDSINLLADISEGTSMEILNEKIGHFEETNIFNGNVGLAAHNRGYKVNYFKKLDKVKIGDCIDYRINDYIKSYKVNSIEIIKDTDWTYLENTTEDFITLITCVKNKPDFRLCVQAHKESEEILNNAKKIFSSRYGTNFIFKCDISRKC